MRLGLDVDDLVSVEDAPSARFGGKINILKAVGLRILALSLYKPIICYSNGN